MNDLSYIVGTCMSNAEISERYDIDIDNVEEIAVDQGIERCNQCEWWFWSFDLVPDYSDQDSDIGYCTECRWDGTDGKTY